jgi:pimeloyl-ACP methyl ester carboxylesterase
MLLGVIALAAALGAAQPQETFVEAKGPLGPLKGTMLSGGAKTAPVVLIVPGSGPTDRDGNNPLGVKASSYRLLAEQLALRGVTSVRIDKRGGFASAAAVADGNAVTIADYASDVHAWASSIKTSTGAPCIWVAGHSEGGLVALAAGQSPSDICGLVLMSAPGRPLADIMKEQLHANPANAPLIPQAEKAIDSLQAKQRVDVSSFPPALAQLFPPAVQGFIIDEFSYDPAALVASSKKPVLIIQGERDLQISVADARRLAKAQPNAKLVLLPEVNHVLKIVSTDDPRANAAAYADPSLPLAPGIADAVADFVKASGSASR